MCSKAAHKLPKWHGVWCIRKVYTSAHLKGVKGVKGVKERVGVGVSEWMRMCAQSKTSRQRDTLVVRLR